MRTVSMPHAPQPAGHHTGADASTGWRHHGCLAEIARNAATRENAAS